MYGPVREPSFPTKIALTLKIVGWLFIIWSVVNFVVAHTPIHLNLSQASAYSVYGSLLNSMAFLHLILGIVLILNGVALSKIIDTVNLQVERLTKR